MAWESRYKTPLTDLFNDENRIKFQVKTELALLKALGEVGRVPREAYEDIKQQVEAGKVTVGRVQEIEASTHHDVMAMVMAMTETSPQYGGFVHYGATSQDINDTVTALQLVEAKNVLIQAVDAVKKQLTRLSIKYRDTACIARTHGQHAIPTTMGFKFANFLYEISTAREYLERAKVNYGKLAGAVGTFASLGTNEVQKIALKELGLEPTPITTQVISRLHLSEYIFALSAVASALERLCRDIRNLQRTEIWELFEGFDASKQVGSSTMPQKRNPHKSERVCGLARIVRAQLMPTLETTGGLEHERDLTNSSVERITLTTATVLTHYMLLQTNGILQNLQVDEERVKQNLHLLKGDQLAERVMMVLADVMPGGRQEAHHLLKKYANSGGIEAGLKSDEAVLQALGGHDEGMKKLEDMLKPEGYIGLAPQVVDEIVAKYGLQE